MGRQPNKKAKHRKPMEFSKKIIIAMLIMMGVHILVSLTAAILRPDIGDYIVAIFNGSLAVYVGGTIGHFGKSGYENGIKIRNNVNQWTTGSSYIEPSDSNG